MKNIKTIKLIAVFASIALMSGFAMPASADMTTAGYYDQFGTFHVYQTYSGPTGGNYGNYGYNANSYYPNNSGYGRPVTTNTYNLRPVTCAAGEIYNATNNICVPPSRNNTVAITGDGYNKPAAQKTTTTTNTGTTGTNASANTDTDNTGAGQASAVGSIFGRKKAPTKLEITDIVITSGPKNIYDDKTDVNCEVLVGWKTSLPAAGQVVYGPLSQSNAKTLDYPFVATEGNTYKTVHEVKLGCLENVTYGASIVQYSGGTNSQRVVSAEQVIFPIKILTPFPVVSGTTAETPSDTSGGASVTGTLGRILTNPFVLLIILGMIGYAIFRALATKKSDAGGHGAVAHVAEPALQIPHH